MLRDFLSWLARPVRRPPRRHRPRPAGCLLWLLVLVVVLIVVALLFGGFRKGTRAGRAGVPAPVSTKPIINGSAPPGAAAPAAPVRAARAASPRQARHGGPAGLPAAPRWL